MSPLLSFSLVLFTVDAFVRAVADVPARVEELQFPAVKSLAVPIDFILYVGEAFASHNESHCANLYQRALHKLFGPDVESAALFKAFFSSYVVTSTMDNTTLRHWKMMARDYQCKMTTLNYATSAQEQYHTKYCAYSIWTDNAIGSKVDGTMYGFCLPSACTERDVRQIVPFLSNYKPASGKMTKDELICTNGFQTEPWWRQESVIAVMSALLLVLVAMVSSTAYDVKVKQEETGAIWPRHFSIARSYRKLWAYNGHSRTVECLRGVRVITMIMIILTHLICFTQSFVGNSEELVRSFRRNPLTVLLYNGTYRVATFFVISGTLLSYSMLGRTRGKKRSRQMEFDWKFCLITIINRYLRLLPVYALAIALTVGVFPHLSDFPAWYVVDPLKQCAGNWWKNLLYINNLEHVQLCMSWTWYLASDFQLFLLHFPLVILLSKRPRLASCFITLFIVCSAILKACLVYAYDYPPSLMLLVPIEGYNQDVASYTFDIYMKPYGWWGSYLVGIYFGFALFNMRKRTPKVLLCHLASALGICMNALCLCSIYWTVQGWRSAVFDLAYVGLSPILWGVGWVLIIGSCHYNTKGCLNRFLSWSLWTPLSNLTYSCYLIHCVIIFAILDWYAKAGFNGPFLPAYSHLETTSLFLITLICSYIGAAFLFLTIEAPSESIRTWLMGRWNCGEQLNPDNVLLGQTDSVQKGLQ